MECSLQVPLSMGFPMPENTEVGYHFFLNSIFLTQGLNPRLLHCRQILYHWVTWEAQGIVRRPKWHHPCQGQHLVKSCFYNHAHRTETEISIFPLSRSSGHRPSSSRSNTSFFRNHLRKKEKSQEEASSHYCPGPWGIGRDIYLLPGLWQKWGKTSEMPL